MCLTLTLTFRMDQGQLEDKCTFAPSVTIYEIFSRNAQKLDLELSIGQRSNINMQIESTYIPSYLISIVMFALSIIFYDIFANKLKCQKFDLENICQSQLGKNVTCAIHLKMLDSILIFFLVLAFLQYTFMQKLTHAHIHSEIGKP